MSAVPIPKSGAKGRRRIILTGDVPSPINPPPGCHFHQRCPYAMARCRVEPPPLREVLPGHFAACHLHDPRVDDRSDDPRPFSKIKLREANASQ